MNYTELITLAIQKNEVVNLMRGDVGYEIPVSKFTSDVFPTDINEILVQCFYDQTERIEDIEILFKNGLESLISGGANDVYIALLYFDTCLFQEEINKASFKIEKEQTASKLKQAIMLHKDELQYQIEFSNGLVKHNPWANIERLNKYYTKKYCFRII